MSRGILLLFVIGSAICLTTSAEPRSGGRRKVSRPTWRKKPGRQNARPWPGCPTYPPIDVSKIPGNTTGML